MFVPTLLLLLLPAATQAFASSAGEWKQSLAHASQAHSHESSKSLLQHVGESSSCSRRNFLSSAGGSVVGASVFSVAAVATQPRVAAATSTVRVAEWPNLAYLEPIYELNLSINALAKTVGDISKWPLVQKRLEKFFKGALLSEKNYYTGVAATYMNEIKYDPSETSEFIKIDKSKRYDAFEACMKNLELLKNDIAANESADNVKADAEAAQRALMEWFSYVPSEDVQAIRKLFISVKNADADRNGRLDDIELQSLSETDRNIWKKRVDLFGDSSLSSSFSGASPSVRFC